MVVTLRKSTDHWMTFLQYFVNGDQCFERLYLICKNRLYT